MLLLDVGGVLSPDTVEVKLGDLSAAHGVPLQELIEVGLGLRRAADLGEMTEEAYWAAVLGRFGVAPADGDLEFASYLSLDDEAMALARQAAERIQVGILSNDSASMARVRRELGGFDELFAPIIISAEVGVIKPDPAVYRLALERAGCTAARCLFVDDREPNIEGARAVGMQAHLFRGAARLRGELEARGIL